MKNYKKLYVEIDENVVKELKRVAKEERVYLSALVEEYLVKVLQEKGIIIK